MLQNTYLYNTSIIFTLYLDGLLILFNYEVNNVANVCCSV